nr:MAG TPA: zinc-ribbon containing domain protein [Caudoviricetes sp.]
MTPFNPDYCPVCNSIDIVAGYCKHCGSEFIAARLMSADQFHKISDRKFKILGGNPHEKRHNVGRR